jgi:hypothetical protein
MSPSAVDLRTLIDRNMWYSAASSGLGNGPDWLGPCTGTPYLLEESFRESETLPPPGAGSAPQTGEALTSKEALTLIDHRRVRILSVEDPSAWRSRDEGDTSTADFCPIQQHCGGSKRRSCLRSRPRKDCGGSGDFPCPCLGELAPANTRNLPITRDIAPPRRLTRRSVLKQATLSRWKSCISA